MKKYYVVYHLHRKLNRAGDTKDEVLNTEIKFPEIKCVEDVRNLEKELVEMRRNAEPATATVYSWQAFPE
jgi:hypothetical protein